MHKKSFVIGFVTGIIFASLVTLTITVVNKISSNSNIQNVHQSDEVAFDEQSQYFLDHDGLRFYVTNVNIGNESEGFKDVIIELVIENTSLELKTIIFGQQNFIVFITASANDQIYYYSSSNDHFLISGLPPEFKIKTTVSISVAITAEPVGLGISFQNAFLEQLPTIPFSLDTETYPQITTFIPQDANLNVITNSATLNSIELSLDWIEMFECEVNLSNSLALGITASNISGESLEPFGLDVGIVTRDGLTSSIWLYSGNTENIHPGGSIKQTYISLCHEQIGNKIRFQDKGDYYVVLHQIPTDTNDFVIYQVDEIPMFEPEVHLSEYPYGSPYLLSETIPKDLIERIQKLSP